MPGYSATPLIKKLGIKEGARVAFVNAPREFQRELGPLPEGAAVVQRARAPLDFVLVFVNSRAELSKRLSTLRPVLAPSGMLWVAWPKKSSGVVTDLSFATVQEAGLATGIVDTKICAIDDVWSGLRFVVRLKDRGAR